ncbi:MAG: hypothetical protein IJR36_02340 [Lachnospiraceae bacterium]|nr:hypothetical protein [Lachnospiraceae bacterium]
MYCVRCGVKLQEGTERCPLCQTPVWNPEEIAKERTYPEDLPSKHSESDIPGAVAFTILCAIASLVVLVVCMKLFGELRWGGYVMLGIALFYVLAILPRWFVKPAAEVFVPVDHAAVLLYLLYVCGKTSGHWFLSFALPVVGASALISTALVCFLKYVKISKLYILGGLLVLLGGFTVLVEFFEHISFGTQMFQWSLYSLTGFAAAGLFLLIAGMIPKLHQALRRRFFF